LKEKRRLHTFIFIALDYVAAAIAWLSFFLYRKYFIEPDKFGYQIPFETSQNFYLGLLYVPLYWLILYYLGGYYNDVWRRSRIKEVSGTFTISIIGVVILFFLLLLDDEVSSYKAYYNTLFILFILHYGFTLFFRLLTATYIKVQLRKKRIGFNTIIVGNNIKALELVNEIQADVISQGYLLVGFVDSCQEDVFLNNKLPFLGNFQNLPQLIKIYEVEEVILTIESSKHNEIIKVTNLLEEEKVILKIIPDIYDMMSGSVKMQNVLGTVLIEINHEILPQWQRVFKRGIDILVSLFALFVFSPIYIALALAVKFSSKGPIFFRQIRIGLHGKPFHIIKYRTMVVNAESDGPALSSKNDQRITPVGKWLRKYRLDEIPQFYNVLIGEMSLVGPRPERKYFIDQIIKIAPHYKHLHRVKPGITSWGQVKYGYAENVEQMVERLKFDILYIENMSIAVDFRIMIYTLNTILRGRGK
jgi:exopolysaccharide biosynthesis polyprenyl glycosylphosphotransferase